jgi:hypothetical protein
MSQVSISEQNGQLLVSSPYHRDFPPRARKIGGKWIATSRCWSFDARDLERVKELCRDIYGTDGSEDQNDLISIRVTWTESTSAGRFEPGDLTCYVAGREVARAYSRDGGAKLGENVVVLEGGFYSCGSAKYPELGVKAGTVIEVRDVPASAKRILADR